MREIKRILIAALAATFIGGLGLGAWIGGLTAGANTEFRSLDTRADEFRETFGLDATQVRRLRTILADHDARVRAIRLQATRRQFRRKVEQEQLSRAKIRAILSKDQRREYDKRLGRG